MAISPKKALVVILILAALYFVNQSGTSKSIVSVSSVSYSNDKQAFIVALVVNGFDTINAIDKSQMQFGTLKAQRSSRIGFTNNQVYCTYQMVPRTAIYGGVFGFFQNTLNYYVVQPPQPTNKYHVSIQSEVGSLLFNTVAERDVIVPPFSTVDFNNGVKITSLGALIGSSQCPSEADVAIVRKDDGTWKLDSLGSLRDFIQNYNIINSDSLNPLTAVNAFQYWLSIKLKTIDPPSGFTVCAPYTTCPNDVNIDGVNMKYTLPLGSYSTFATAELSKDFVGAITIVQNDGNPINLQLSSSKPRIIQGEYAQLSITFTNGGTTDDAFDVNVADAGNALIEIPTTQTVNVLKGATATVTVQLQGASSSFVSDTVFVTVVAKSGKYISSSIKQEVIGQNIPTPTGTLTPTATPTIIPTPGSIQFVCPDGSVVASKDLCPPPNSFGGIGTILFIGAALFVGYFLLTGKGGKRRRK